MTTPAESDVQWAMRRLRARIIASAHLLGKPFTDQPELSPWDLLKRDLETLDAALKRAWVVQRIQHDESRSVKPLVRGGRISRAAGQSDPDHTRFYAAQLLAAADAAEAELRKAGRP